MIRCLFSCFFTLAALCLFMPLMAKDNIKIETFRGAEIAPHIKEVIKLCDSIYREYPYLYNGDDAEYTAYIESYSQSNDAITCLAFDGKNAVGLAIGIPMSKTRDLYKQTLMEHGIDLDKMFYLGEFGVKSEYRNNGIEEKMYLEIENFAKQAGSFNMIGLWEIQGAKTPSEISKDEFWKKMGFMRRPDLHFDILWTNIGDSKESTHLAVYSIKKI